MKSEDQRSGWSSFLSAMLIGRKPKWTLVRIVVLVALVFLAREFVLIPIRSVGPSMMPTYQDGGVNLVYRLAYRSHEPQRGDVVAIRYAGNSIMLMKRIIGLPGETVAFRAGRAVINGEPLEEPYVQYPSDWNLPPVTIDPDKYLVVGDNRSMPPEAHTFGQAERKRIIGKILLCKNLFASSPPQR
jgi:signal peptidase I